jgi:nucleoside-diphosphate-sugar epimerase
VLALAETVSAGRLVHFSSGAVSRSVGASRQAYAQMKAAHERTVADWAGRHGGSVLMPRVFNLGGPYINHAGDYALGDFILQTRRGGRIAIGAAHPVFRNFIHVCEMAAVVLEMATCAAPGTQVLDIAGGEVVELSDLARAVGVALGMGEVEIERPAPSDREADWYVGDGAAYQAALAQAGARPIPLTRIVADTAAYMESAGLS